MPGPTICARCGEEVRWGSREGSNPAYLHREAVDHPAILGHVRTPEEQAKWEHDYYEVVRYMEDGTPYTTAEYDRKKYSKAKRAELDEADDIEPEPLPDPEVRARPIDISEFEPRSGIRQIYNLIRKTTGWSVTSLTYARGPRIGATGGSLGMADSVLLRAKQDKALDGTMRVAVASWIDGAFNIAWVGTVAKDNVISPIRVNSNEMKDWIRT